MISEDSSAAPDADVAREYWLLMVEEDRAECAPPPRTATDEEAE